MWQAETGITPAPPAPVLPAADSAINGWEKQKSPGGRLSLDVNVRAPRGTKVDAGVTGGDFIPADRGISVNREMTQE
jgi:hypothetical protein